MITFFIAILFLCFAAREIFFWTFLWQLKEYRLDRMLVHIRDTRQGQKAIFSLETLLLIVILFLYGVVLQVEQFSGWYLYIVAAFFFYEFVLTVKKVLIHAVRRPIRTAKSIGIIVLSFFTIAVLTLLPLTDYSLWLICVALVLPLIVSLYVFLFAFPTEIYTDLYLQKAKKYRDRLKDLTVIAISGSYGKSSTKEIIAHVLSKKFIVAKTLLSQNTPLAVASALLKKVDINTNFFIAELGAYKKGEIDQLTKIVKPSIGVTTAVSDQHLALYGGMDEVVASEMELIHAIPKKSFVLLNGNSENMHLISKQTTRKIYWYKTADSLKKRKDAIVAYDISPSTSGVSFSISYKDKEYAFRSPLLGVHTVENILPAIFLAFHFGLSEKEIAHALLTLKPMPKTMEKKHFFADITVIDDTFNASPESVASAIEYLKLFAKRKILVMSPLIELGKMAKERHLQIGHLLAGVDMVLLTNKNFLYEIKQGIDEKKGKTKIICDTYENLAKFLKQNLTKGDAVVFEGKEAGIVLHQL